MLPQPPFKRRPDLRRSCTSLLLQQANRTAETQRLSTRSEGVSYFGMFSHVSGFPSQIIRLKKRGDSTVGWNHEALSARLGLYMYDI